MKYSHLVLMISNTYCRFDANGLQILNSSLSVCNSLGDSGQADFEGDGFFVKPNDGVLVRGTNKGKTYEVAINPNTNKIFDIHSNEKNFLYLDTASADLVVNGNIHAKSLYLQEIGGENVIKYIDGKSKIDSPYLNVKGLNVNDNLKIDSNGILTTTGSIFSDGTIKASNIEGSIIKGAKIFAGYPSDEEVNNAPVGTIKGAKIESSDIYATTIYGISKAERDNLAANPNLVYPEISGKSYKLMSGENQKFGLTLGEDENQTVYMNLGQGTGGEVTVNDMVYGEDSLMIQKEADVAKIYIVGRKCSIDLYENENIDISVQNEIHLKGTKVFANEIELVPEIKALQKRCALLESKIEALENRPSV